MTAGVQKIFHDDPRIGFLSMAAKQEKDLPALAQAVEAAKTGANKEVVVAAEKKLRDTRTLRFNNLLDAVIAGIFLVLVALIVLVSASEWALLLARKRLAELRETEPVWLPDYAVAEGKPVKWLGLFALALVALKELSGQNAVDRAQACAQPRVNLLGGRVAMERDARQQAYVKATEERFNGVKRCC
jgi:carbon starvation protein